ncbi:MAG: SusC/RagA family TonB-linked outer membrane protein, partial [Muribaculaceae bacterium]|nr:SusC/RagA family TonB-linked outer membrane protein [Muribaculaceae bacterium]
MTLLLTCGMPLSGSMTALANPEPQTQQQGVESITGTVYDENNEPVIGATVSANGAKGQGVMTDAFGHFTLKARVGAPITIGYVGYKTVEMPASRDMQVYLQPTTEILDQLVVVGYGEQKRANLTGAVASVDVARTLDSRPQTDVMKALQGSVPGLTITTTNGGVSESANIKIRGVGTLSNGQESAPLIVVDGVPTDNLDFLNPDDVAEISVLKDASSSAIYGARAAFGVILVTTKTASTKDRVSVKYDNNFSWSSATVLPTMSLASDNIRYALQSAKRGSGAWETEVGKQPYEKLLDWAEQWESVNDLYTDYVELRPYVDQHNIGDYYVTDDGKMYRYAQWDVAKTLLSSAAPSQKHNVSLEGTSGKTQYRVSFGYDSKQGLQRFSPEKMKRYMANFSVSTEIFKFLKAGARFSFSQREYTDPNTIRNSYQYLWRWNSIEESYGYATHNGYTLPFRNDISNRMLAHTDKEISRQTRMQAWVLATIMPGLTLQADFTYDLRTKRENDAYTTSSSWNTWTFDAWQIFTSPTQESSFVRRNSADGDRWTANAFATYAKTFAADHNLKVMAGFSADRYTYDQFQILRRGVIDMNLANLNLTDGTNFTTTASANRHATAGFFGRVNYDYKGIYLFEANGRYDGSSSFPQNKQWAFFPSVSAGYRFSEEAYFKSLKSWWSNGKIRASYGHIGNENVGANQFISTMSPVTSYWLNGSGLPLTMFGAPTLVSDNLTWERVVTTDVGVDLGFFNNSLTFGFDWYQRETQDMLARGQELPSVLGTSAPLTNSGTLRTRGWELSIGWNHSFGDAQVYANFNIGDALTKITKWSDNKNLYQAIPGTYALTRYHEGQTLGEIYGFDFDRLFEEIDF